MRKRIKNVFWLAGITGAVLTGLVRGQTAPPKSGPAKVPPSQIQAAILPAAVQTADPITQRAIARLIEEAAPHLSRVLALPEGATVKPKVKFLSVAEFRKLPDLETDLMARSQVPQLSGKALEHALKAARDATAAVALARYCPGTDTIAVTLPVDEQRIAKWSPTVLPDPPELAANRMLQIALVHEICRYYLDGRYHWAERLEKCRDDDEATLWLELVEGRTQQLTEAVADALGSVTYHEFLTQRYRTFAEDGPDPERLAVVKAAVFRQRHAACADGKAFFAALQKQAAALPSSAGRSLEATTFTNPPRQAFWISRPELYRKWLTAPSPDLKEVLARLEAKPPAPKWTAEQHAMGPEMVRSVAAMFDEKPRGDAVARTMEEGRGIAWMAGDRRGTLNVILARFESPAAARSYHGFALDLQRKRDQMMASNCTGGCRIIDSQCRTLEVSSVEAAVQCSKKMQYGAGAPVAANMIYVLTGAHVIEIDAYYVDPDPAWVLYAVDTIVNALKTGADRGVRLAD